MKQYRKDNREENSKKMMGNGNPFKGSSRIYKYYSTVSSTGF